MQKSLNHKWVVVVVKESEGDAQTIGDDKVDKTEVNSELGELAELATDRQICLVPSNNKSSFSKVRPVDLLMQPRNSDLRAVRKRRQETDIRHFSDWKRT